MNVLRGVVDGFEPCRVILDAVLQQADVIAINQWSSSNSGECPIRKDVPAASGVHF
jgi:hypothetical protein